LAIHSLHAHVALKFLDRDFARKAVIGAIEADDPGDQAFDERRSLAENGLQNCLLPLEGQDIARIAISVGIARNIGDGLARLAIGDDALDLERDLDVIVGDDLIVFRQHVDNLCFVAVGRRRCNVGGRGRPWLGPNTNCA
jgi:hypothetical protein